MGITDEQRRYYGALYRRFGDDPRAVGHRDRPTQRERFSRMSRGWENEPERFSVHEIGSGLGDFGQFLGEHVPRAIYSGSEILEEFVIACRRRFPGRKFSLRDISNSLPAERYDYVVQSGTFNGRLQTPTEQWREFVFATLRAMYAMARKGIVSNFLTTYCDRERMREELHYQDESELVDFVVRDLSRHFELDMAGPLYEYTLRVYRPEFLRSRYDGEVFDRYFRHRAQG